MMAKRKNEAGEIINGFLFIKELPGTAKNRRGLFKCPICDKEFEYLLCGIVRGIKKDCGCQPRQIKTRLGEYRDGELVNGIKFIREVEKNKQHRRGLFECPLCKEEYITNIRTVVNGMSKSCGCQNGRKSLHGHASGGKLTSEYETWCSIKYRCYYPTCQMYHIYGGRGITVCDRWKDSFQNFFDDMGAKPSPKHSIERIDFNGNYEPTNCRWATTKEQARNTRRTLFVTYKGVKKPLIEWAEELKFPYEQIRVRIRNKGWSVEKAFETPVPNGRKKRNISNFISYSFGHISAA